MPFGKTVAFCAVVVALCGCSSFFEQLRVELYYIGTHSHTEGKREQLHLNFFTALHKPGFKLYLQCSALSSFERRENVMMMIIIPSA